MPYLEHANVTVRKIEDSLSFLKIACPTFKVRSKGARADGGGNWLHFGNDEFYIAFEERTEPVAKIENLYTQAGVNHLGLVVEDMDRIVNDLDAAGFRKGIPGEDIESRRRRYYFDDNGFEWELVEYLTEDPALRNQYI